MKPSKKNVFILFCGGTIVMIKNEKGSLEPGVIPANDMTPEAAVTKMKWALGLAQNEIEKGRLKNSDVVGFVNKIFNHNRANEVTLAKSMALPVKN